MAEGAAEGATPKKKRGRRRWVQEIKDLQMSVGLLDVEHLAYNRVVFRRVVEGAKLRKGHCDGSGPTVQRGCHFQVSTD
jgi:hypothetical protein